MREVTVGEVVLVLCPNGHNFPAAKVDGEGIGPVIQEFICPACQNKFQQYMPFQAVVTSLSHNPSHF
jgi:hypothetical protein